MSESGNTSLSYILSIDSAMGGCAVGVYAAGRDDVFSEVIEQSQGQATHLVPMVQRCVEAADIAFADLDLVSVSIGPGSFTGVRTGMSSARSFALALDIPLVGLSSFDILAYMAREGRVDGAASTICVLVESRRQELFAQLFDGEGRALSEPMLALSADLEAELFGRDVVYVGDGVTRFFAETGGAARDGDLCYVLADPAVMARLAMARFDDPSYVRDEMAKPLYLRDADVSVSKKIQRVLKV